MSKGSGSVRGGANNQWSAFGMASERGSLIDKLDKIADSKEATSQLFNHKYSAEGWHALVDNYFSKVMSERELNNNSGSTDQFEKYVQEHGKEKTLNVKDLTPTQPWIGEAIYSIGSRYLGQSSPIAVVHVDGTDKNFVVNGHHRAIAQIVYGKKTVKAYVVNVPKSVLKRK